MVERAQLTESGIFSLNALIRKLEDAAPLGDDEARRKNQVFVAEATARMFQQGGTFGQAAAAPSILNQPYEAFRAEQRAIANDLGRQVELVDQFVSRWFDFGEFIPPAWPWRVTVILRKAKRLDLERRFLAALSRHVDYGRHGGTGQKVTERAAKLILEIEGALAAPSLTPPSVWA